MDEMKAASEKIRLCNKTLSGVFRKLHDDLCDCGTVGVTDDVFVHSSTFRDLVEPVWDLVRTANELANTVNELHARCERQHGIYAKRDLEAVVKEMKPDGEVDVAVNAAISSLLKVRNRHIVRDTKEALKRMSFGEFREKHQKEHGGN